MPDRFALWVVLSWLPAALVLARVVGPRRAAMVAILGGYLFLPRGVRWEVLGPISIEKRTIPGLAALLIVLAFDRRTLSRLRPSWLDLPMIALVIAPMLGAAARRFATFGVSVDQSWMNLTGWAIPYMIGRLYYDDADGPRRMAGSIAIGGLLYVPICWFETSAGPGWYLSGLLYGTSFYEGMVERLGGFRPEGFLGNGIEVAAWMALTTVAASWLCLSRSGWRPFGLPPWTSAVAAVVLGLTTLACRGVYGYSVLAIGLTATCLTLAMNTRLFLMALVLVAPAYIVARTSGAWDGREMREWAQKTGRSASLSMRLEQEADVLKNAPETGLVFGRGGPFPDWGIDSWWAGALKNEGIVGVITLYSAFLIPAGLVIFGPPRRFPPRSVSVGLAMLVVLHMIHNLHNGPLIVSTQMINGTLVAAFLTRRPGPTSRARRDEPAPPRNRIADNRGPGRTLPVALGATLVVLAVVEVLGRLSRTPWVGQGPPPHHSLLDEAKPARPAQPGAVPADGPSPENGPTAR
jgi:hypothetical protein